MKIQNLPSRKPKLLKKNFKIVKLSEPVLAALQMVREELRRFTVDLTSLSKNLWITRDAKENLFVEQKFFNVNVRLRKSFFEKAICTGYSRKELEYAGWITDVITTTVSIIFPKLAMDTQSIAASILVYLDLLNEDIWVKVMKYNLNWLFCKNLKQESPDDIESWHEDGFLLAGPLGRQVRTRLLRMGNSQKDLIILNTVLQGIKKGLPPLSDKVVQKTIQAQKDRLTQTKITPPDVLEDVEEIVLNLSLKKIQVGSVSPLYKLSTHASFERPRSFGGSWGETIQFESIFPEDSIDLNPKIFRSEVSSIGYEGISHMVLSFKSLLYMNCQPTLGLELIKAYEDFIVVDPIKNLRSETFRSMFSEITQSSKVEPIQEPIKVRMISKSSTRINGIYNELSELVFNQLVKRFEFSNCKKEFTETDCNELYRNCVDFWGDEELVCLSGDFEASTDMVHMDITKVILPLLTNDPISLKILERALTEQILFIDHKSMKGTELFNSCYKQTNGQLMGCRFSFPILCMFNLCLYISAAQRYSNKGFKAYLTAGLVKIVGDDLLSFIPRKMVTIWEQTCSSGGLKKSLGKNYVSDRFAVFCSRMFRKTFFKYYDEGVYTRWIFVPYMNMGFPFAMKKGGGKGGYQDFSRKELNEQLEKLFGSFEDTWKQWLPKVLKERFVGEIRKHRRDVMYSCLDDFSLGLIDYPTNEQKSNVQWALRFRNFISQNCRFSILPEKYQVLDTFNQLYFTEVREMSKDIDLIYRSHKFIAEKKNSKWSYIKSNTSSFLSSLVNHGNHLRSVDSLRLGPNQVGTKDMKRLSELQ
jgi:hypothetical protein